VEHFGTTAPTETTDALSEKSMTLSTLPRIERLHLADLVLPDDHPEAGRGRRSVVFGFAIDHLDGAIVVDTGVGRGNDFIDQLYDPTVWALDELLAGVGIEPSSVAAVVNSHLHFDHCGQNSVYYGTSVPLYVQADEVEAARQPLYTVPEWAEVPADQLRAVRGDETIAEGVRILATPGHTHGHQSVVVKADEGSVVVAAQAVWAIDEFLHEEATSANIDSEALRDVAVDSIRRLRALSPDAVYFSHDPDIFRRV
jgi:N-acyl homoserine lactone hydrolase